jgi:hypothetical protein
MPGYIGTVAPVASYEWMARRLAFHIGPQHLLQGTLYGLGLRYSALDAILGKLLLGVAGEVIPP